MTPVERRILINQRTIMRALYRAAFPNARALTDDLYQAINEDMDATLKLLKEESK